MKTQIFLIDDENVQPDVLPALALEDVKVLVFVGPHQGKLPFSMVEAMQKLGGKAEYVRVTRAGDNALDMHIALHLGRLSQQMPDAYFHIILETVVGRARVGRHGVGWQGATTRQARACKKEQRRQRAPGRHNRARSALHPTGEAARGQKSKRTCESQAENKRSTAISRIPAKDRDYDSVLEHVNQPIKRAAKWHSLDDVPLLRRFQAKTVPAQADAVLRWFKERPKNRPRSRKTLFNTLMKAVFAEQLDEAAINAILAQLEKQKALTIDGKNKVHYGSAMEDVVA